MRSTAPTAREPTTTVTAVLDLLSAGERHADRLAIACAAALTAQGGADLSITSHPAALGELRHVAIVVEVTGLAGPAVRAVLEEVADAEDAARPGLLVDDRCTGEEALEPVLRAVLAAHGTRSGGRAVVFPGQGDVPPTTTVGALLEATATQQVQVIGGPEPDGATTLLTRGFLRPRWVAGQLVLHVQPAVGGVLVPFETPDPTPCCAVHA